MTPERLRQAAPVQLVRSRAPSPRRSTGDERFILPPRIHRASDPGLPPGADIIQCIPLRACAWVYVPIEPLCCK